ncbi:hypothetical protein B0H13DRAFT_1982800 [Mycena leptocephala]|nr:hypothetical protein B0H13DRAFT_1982800 [Mycena leptocephala]
MSDMQHDVPAPPRQASPLNFDDHTSNAGSNRADERSAGEKETDRKLAERLSIIIEDANSKCTPSRKEEDRDEDELIKNVKPLLEQAEKILNETNGAATRNMRDHKATPDEQRLAEALKVMVEEVGGTIQWARDKLDAYPKAKRDLGPLLEAVSRGTFDPNRRGVMLLLAGVLNLVDRLLSALGLDSLLKGIIAATGLDKIYRGLGLEKWLKG